MGVFCFYGGCLFEGFVCFVLISVGDYCFGGGGFYLGLGCFGLMVLLV